MPLVFLNRSNRAALQSLTSRDWARLALLGLIFYTLTQGSQFLSLNYLPAAMVSLLLNLTPLVVGLFGVSFLREQPARGQWLGIALTVLGVAVYFLPVGVESIPAIGLLVALGGVVSNAVSALLGRKVNRLAGNCQHSFCIHFVESHPADVIRCGVKHRQQPDAAADRDLGFCVSGRDTEWQANHWARPCGSWSTDCSVKEG